MTYLAARLADTITDCGNWSTEERLKNLENWESAVLASGSRDWILKSGLGSFEASEAELLLRGGEILKGLRELTSFQGEPSREVLKTLFSAMRWDLKSFSDASARAPTFGCKDLATFDWYTFSIAGCVGRYWVKIFELNHHLDSLAVEYGKALQRINILRDFREDWQRGRVYWPKTRLAEYEIEDVEPWRSTRWSEAVSAYIRETQLQLRYGANFCDAIPYSKWRLRFASMMPLLIGQSTLALIEDKMDFDSTTKMKIKRKNVRRLIWKAFFYVLSGKSLSRSIRLEEQPK